MTPEPMLKLKKKDISVPAVKPVLRFERNAPENTQRGNTEKNLNNPPSLFGNLGRKMEKSLEAGLNDMIEEKVKEYMQNEIKQAKAQMEKFQEAGKDSSFNSFRTSVFSCDSDNEENHKETKIFSYQTITTFSPAKICSHNDCINILFSDPRIPQIYHQIQRKYREAQDLKFQIKKLAKAKKKELRDKNVQSSVIWKICTFLQDFYKQLGKNNQEVITAVAPAELKINQLPSSRISKNKNDETIDLKPMANFQNQPTSQLENCSQHNEILPLSASRHGFYQQSWPQQHSSVESQNIKQEIKVIIDPSRQIQVENDKIEVQMKFMKAKILFNENWQNIIKTLNFQKSSNSKIQQADYIIDDFEEQRLIILSLFELKFDKEQLSHRDIMTTVKNHFAEYFNNETFKILSQRQKRGSKLDYNIFEQDIFESIGFQNGRKPHSDLREGGLFSLAIIINFLEKIDKLYQNVDITIDAQKHFMHNFIKISQNNNSSNFNGFPIILVLIHIITKIRELIDSKYQQSFNDKQIQQRKLIKKQQILFQNICENHFFGNLYDTITRFFHHFVCTFLMIWKDGLENAENQLKSIQEYYSLQEDNVRENNFQIPRVIYLYKQYFFDKINNKKNKNSILDFNQVFNQTLEFIMKNLDQLIMIESKQSTFANMVEQRQKLLDRKSTRKLDQKTLVQRQFFKIIREAKEQKRKEEELRSREIFKLERKKNIFKQKRKIRVFK